MPAPGFALGIDLGTSNTVAVLRWPDGRAKPLLFDGTPLLPSAVYAEPSGNLLVGRDAVHSARLDPARYEPNPKRRIDDGTVLLGEREVPVADLFAAVLRRVADEARQVTGGRVPASTTLTCPANWATPRRSVLTTAAANAGLGNVRIVEEPVAAAAYFAHVLGRKVPEGGVLVVHDLGAGTFDVSVVANEEVLAVDGRDDIGGLDVDEAVVAHLGRVYASKDPEKWARLINPSTVEDRRHRRLLWDDVRVAKERLSRAQSADLMLPLLDVEAHLTRDELDDLAKPILEQTVTVTQGAIQWAGKRREPTATRVFLVGGASRIPLLATLLHRALGQPPVAIEQPELVVAEGSLFATSTRPTDPAATVVVSAIPISMALAPVSPVPVSPAGAVSAGGAGFAAGRAALLTRPAAPAAEEMPEPIYVHREPSRFWPFVRGLLITVLLGATPVVAAYVVYKLALHEPLLPLRVAWDKIM